METICEVIGWLLDDDQPQVLVREKTGEISLQRASADFGQFAIQTGAFRRGNPIIDPVTKQTMGYEMERISSAACGVAI